MSTSLRVEHDGSVVLPAGALRDILSSVVGRGDCVRFRARGVSMLPFIHEGDLLTVGPWRPGPLKVGDVIAFQRLQADRVSVHRVVKTLNDGVVAKGDAAVNVDGVIPFDRVLGRVSKVERDGREVRAGLGPERRLLAVLSRSELLLPLVTLARQVRSVREAVGWRS
jgi:hypothetical protein